MVACARFNPSQTFSTIRHPPVIPLPDSLHAWPGPNFATTLKAELEALPAGSLPLAQGSRLGGCIDDSAIVASVLRSTDTAATIKATVGIFFSEILTGCSCSEDPDIQPAYCEFAVAIDKRTAMATVSLREP